MKIRHQLSFRIRNSQILFTRELGGWIMQNIQEDIRRDWFTLRTQSAQSVRRFVLPSVHVIHLITFEVTCNNIHLTMIVGTPILSHIDPACNTSYHFAASRTVLPRVPPYLARDCLRLLAHVYDSVASIHMTKNPGRHG